MNNIIILIILLNKKLLIRTFFTNYSKKLVKNEKNILKCKNLHQTL